MTFFYGAIATLQPCVDLEAGEVQKGRRGVKANSLDFREGSSKMVKLVRTLSSAFLGAFVFTSAFAQFNATSGSMVIGVGDLGSPYSIAGPDFSALGSFATDGATILQSNPLGPGPLPSPFYFYSDTQIPNLTISLTVHGVPWSLPVPTNGEAEGAAQAQFDVAPGLVLTGPGIYSTTFTFGLSFIGAPESVVSGNPGAGCEVLMCQQLIFGGGGIVKFDVVPDQVLPGTLDISQAAFTFSAPTPSTVPLLLLGLAALGFQVWGRTRGQRVN